MLGKFHFHRMTLADHLSFACWLSSHKSFLVHELQESQSSEFAFAVTSEPAGKKWVKEGWQRAGLMDGEGAGLRVSLGWMGPHTSLTFHPSNLYRKKSCTYS